MSLKKTKKKIDKWQTVVLSLSFRVLPVFENFVGILIPKKKKKSEKAKLCALKFCLDSVI